LNAGHAPDHLEMKNPFSGVTKAVTDTYNAAANSEFTMHQLNRATDEEVILYEFSQKTNKEDALNLMLMSNEIRANSDEFLKHLLKSPKIKSIIMNQWYSNRPITEQIQRDVFKNMKLTK
jgi:hypothetical protein